MSADDERGGILGRRLGTALVVYGVVGVAWLLVFPLDIGDLEPLDITFAALSLGFAAGSGLLLFRVDIPVLEVGWSLFTLSYYVRLLDEVAEGPESLEALLPGTIELVGLGVILLGFVRTTGRLKAGLSERNERLAVINRVLRHNLRNDLSTIINSLQYFDERASDEESSEYARLGLERAWDLSALSDNLRRIDDVLDDSVRGETHARDVAAIVESSVETARERYPGVAFEVTTPPEATATVAEGVGAAVDSLVENACEHNDAAERTVDVTVESAESGAVTVTVRDNGPGIPDEELDAIRRGSESALTHGSGIGLWLVAWVVERSGGGVTFEYDDGQVVTIRLPASG